MNPFVPTLVALLALALVAPPAAAGHGKLPVPHLDQDAFTVGPCEAGYGFYWPGNLVAARCTHGGTEVVFVAFGTASLGYTCTARVLGATLASCPGWPPVAPGEIVLP